MKRGRSAAPRGMPRRRLSRRALPHHSEDRQTSQGRHSRALRLVQTLLLVGGLMVSLTSPDHTAATVVRPSPQDTGFWWDDAWPYRIPVTVTGSGVAEVAVNFTAIFAELGLNAALLDLRSIRVVDAGGTSIPYAETYSTLLEDAESPQIGWHATGVSWTVNDGVATADSTRASQGTGSLKAVIENRPGGYGYPGVELRIATGDPLTDWRPYESFLYDVWPEVNASARDQAPDLYWFKLYNTGCPQDNLTQGGPPLAVDRWNAASVSLRPLHTCTAPDLKAITRMEFHTRDNETVKGNSGLWDDGDILTLWFDNLRLVDQETGALRWNADGATETYTIYFDTLAHEGHPLPALAQPTGTPVAATPGAPEAGGYLHTITGAQTDDLAIWTAPPVEKLPRTHAVPAVAAPLRIQAARDEFEPFQLVIRSPTARSLPVTISDFVPVTLADARSDAAHAIPATVVTLHRVDTIPLTRLSDAHGRLGDWPDPLLPLSWGDAVAFPADQNQPLWFTVHVPRDAAPGQYQAMITIGAATVPVELEVWDFALPQEILLASEWGFGWSQVVEAYGGTDGGSVQPCYWDLVDALYEDFASHRLTPKGVGWPAGLNYPGGVAYDCAGTLDPDAWGDWDFHTLAQRYLLGDDLANGTGFPTFLIKGPSSNWPPASRPSSFCGASRGTDPPGDPAYNTAWFQYWSAVSDYLGGTADFAERGTYHIVNEPQTFDDYDIVAYLAQRTKAAAPHVRILVSEQVEPLIYANPTYPDAKIDIWMPTISNYQVERAHDRQLNHGESVWWYFLYGDRPPLPNPTVIDRPGIEARIVPWLAWLERVDGLAYYATTDWGAWPAAPNPWTDPWLNDANGDAVFFYPPQGDVLASDPCDPASNRLIPSLRWELLREGMEDYAYLWLLNGGAPEIGTVSEADALAQAFIDSRTRFSRVPTDLTAARTAIGATLHAAHAGPTATKQAHPPAVAVGATLTYTLVYRAGAVGHTLALTDTVPEATALLSATATHPSQPTITGQVVRWEGTLAARDVLTLTLVATAAQPGPVTNSATFTGAPDSAPLTAEARALIYTARVFLPTIMVMYNRD